MVYLLPTKNEILIWDKNNIVLTNDMEIVPEPTYRITNPFSFWKYRNLRKRSIIIGFVGPRGSGKSVGAARTVIIDYMLRGKPVWSNMEIGFDLISNGQIIPVKSKPLEKLSLVELDQVYSNGVIYVDEVNLLAEARRSMSNENLMFSYILQQLRHRRLSIIWSAQSENHCDDRLRWQTDIFILCEDVSISKPNCDIGAYSRWKAHDYSGIVMGRTFSSSDANTFYKATIWNKPWWNTYSTWKLQEVGVGSIKTPSPEQEEAARIASEITQYMEGEQLSAIWKRSLWRRFKVTDINMKMRIGQVLSSIHGIITNPHNHSEYIVEESLEGA